MFTVDAPTAAAIRRAYDEGGDLASIVESRRHFPLIADHAKARECVKAVLSWTPLTNGLQRKKAGRAKP